MAFLMCNYVNEMIKQLYYIYKMFFNVKNLQISYFNREHKHKVFHACKPQSQTSNLGDIVFIQPKLY